VVPDPLSLALKVAPLAKPAIRKLLGLNEVVALFALLRRHIEHSGEIPHGKHSLVWERVRLQGADPDIAGCLNAYLTGGDMPSAGLRVRHRLSELLRFEDPDIDDAKMVALVADSIEANLSKAALDGRDANRIEHTLTRAATTAALSEVRAQLRDLELMSCAASRARMPSTSARSCGGSRVILLSYGLRDLEPAGICSCRWPMSSSLHGGYGSRSRARGGRPEPNSSWLT
jgi:hypothetical protein